MPKKHQKVRNKILTAYTDYDAMTNAAEAIITASTSHGIIM